MTSTQTFTPAELAKFDGSDEAQPVYVAIKGTGEPSWECSVVFGWL